MKGWEVLLKYGRLRQMPNMEPRFTRMQAVTVVM